MKKLLHSLSNLFNGKRPLSVEEQLRAFAYKRYPDNVQAQNYIFEEEMTAYEHMKMANDKELKEIAQRQYPYDYAMQEYIYNHQREAKKYMNSIEDSSTKHEAKRRYPKDYFTQKYIYGLLSNGSKRSA